MTRQIMSCQKRRCRIQLRRVALAVGGCVVEGGCVRAPSVDVIGSFFPAWMVCVTAAIVVTFIIRAVLVRVRLESEVGPLALFYPSLVLLLSCGLWLMFYR
jgi:hypothetical protein